MEKLDACLQSGKINGTEFSQEELDRYNKVVLLCISLFKPDEPTEDTKIEIEEPTKENAYVSVNVYTDCFETNAENKEEYIELIRLADTSLHYSQSQNQFLMKFSVKGIWSEK